VKFSIFSKIAFGINCAGFVFLPFWIFFDAAAISYPKYFDSTEIAQYFSPLAS
jgi:hypothetical protein